MHGDFLGDVFVLAFSTTAVLLLEEFHAHDVADLVEEALLDCAISLIDSIFIHKLVEGLAYEGEFDKFTWL